MEFAALQLNWARRLAQTRRDPGCTCRADRPAAVGRRAARAPEPRHLPLHRRPGEWVLMSVQMFYVFVPVWLVAAQCSAST